MSSTLVWRALALAGTAFIAAACGGAASSGSSGSVGASASIASTPSSPTTAPETTSPTQPTAVRPGEPWIAYQGGTGGPARIRLVRPDGTGDHELTPGEAPGEQFHPDWSRDGKRVAFAVDDIDGTRDIWVANVDGSDVRQVFDCESPCGWTDSPAWSPGDATLAFEHGFLVDGATGEGDSTIEILDLASGTSHSAFDAAPAEYAYIPRWSPDGGSIVFELDRFDSARLDAENVVASTLVVVSADGAAEPRLVLPWDSWATYPDWHPTEDLIAYVAPTKVGREEADVLVVSIDGTDPQRVTDFGHGGGWAIQPSWTPDGRRIIFVGEDVVRTTPNAATVLPDGTGLERMAWDGTHRTHPRLRPTP